MPPVEPSRTGLGSAGSTGSFFVAVVIESVNDASTAAAACSRAAFAPETAWSYACWSSTVGSSEEAGAGCWNGVRW